MQIINYYEHYNIAHIAKERFEQKLYEAETLIEAFEVLKDMFDTLMAEVASLNSLGPILEKVNFEELELAPQNEAQNVQDTVKKYEAEIKSLSKRSDELKKLALESEAKHKDLQLEIRDLQEDLKASRC
jgi:chromosome segregation ATPase